jgi:hypothetical protein
MSKRADRLPLGGLPLLLGALVVIEFVFLRTATRTLVHIPGLGRFETPIRALAEVGRWGYYLAIVTMIGLLGALAYKGLRQGSRRGQVAGLATALYLLLAGAGRAGVLGQDALGWASLAIVALLAAVAWRGARTIPITLFALASLAAGVSVLGQGTGGGLTGQEVDVLVLSAEVLLVLAAVTTPLLLEAGPTRSGVVIGLVTAFIGIGALVSGGPTLSILVLWNLGVPGWLSGVAYALALGALTATLWTALATRNWLTSVGLLLMVAGGIGVISTYQTGLVIAGILLLDSSLGEAASPSVPPIVIEDGDETARIMAVSPT